jgi:predicted metal-binding membrane protein
VPIFTYVYNVVDHDDCHDFTQCRSSNIGAFSMGLRHGTFCLGCCCLQMLHPFAGGIINLFRVAGLAMFVLLEKVFARGVWFSRLAGRGLIISGLVMLSVDYL